MPAYLRLPRHRRNLTHLPTLQRINHTTLPHVRISHEPDRDLFLITMELRELAEELDEGAFAEGVVRRGVEGDGGVARGEVLDVAGL